MARKVKCQICGKELTNETAFKVTKGKRNLYYCTQEEYDYIMGEKGRRDKFYKFLEEELNQKYIPPMMVKEINALVDKFEYETIRLTFVECRDVIQRQLQKVHNQLEYNTTRYIMSIIGNNINRVDKKRQEEIEDLKNMFSIENKINDNLDLIDMNLGSSPHSKKDTNDISDFLD